MQHCVPFLFIILTLSMFSFTPNLAYSQLGKLTVKVDKSDYKTGETVMISGTVPAVVEGEPVAIQMFNPRHAMVAVAQLTPSSDRTYSTNVKLESIKCCSVPFLSGIEGVYTVKATYLGESVQTTFNLEVLGTICFGCFEPPKAQACLSNGMVHKIEVNQTDLSLVISVATTYKDGNLTITLPRELIDAKTDGEDHGFIVLVDGKKVDFEETEKTSTERKLMIPVPAGAEGIEVVGTHVIPEFPLVQLFAFTASISFVIVMVARAQKPIKKQF